LIGTLANRSPLVQNTPLVKSQLARNLMPRLTLAIPLSLLCLAAVPTSSRATPFVFNLDPAQSRITLSIESSDGTLLSSAQTPNSDVTSISGTFKADVTASTIQFLSTNNAQFALQNTPQSPLASGASGSSLAQYGLSLAINGVGGGVVAARNYVGDATSGVIPLTGGTFDGTKTNLSLATGITSYNLTLFGSPVVGMIDTNSFLANTLSGGTLTSAGGVYTLHLPVLVPDPLVFDGVPLTFVYSGELVGTATVPEPASVLLAAIGVAVLVCCRRRGF
jgi:PEP-CTERM motif